MSNSPICTVNDLATTDGVDVTASSSPTISLADTAGVRQWNISCISTDGLNTPAAINATLSVNLAAKRASFTAPAALGSALIFQSVINNGVDLNGVAQPSYTTTFKVSVLTASALRVLAFNEMLENNAAFGWTEIVNYMIRNYTSAASSSGAGLTGFYAVGQNADGSIIVNADDIQLKPAFSTLLNGATASATAGTLVLRNGSGGGVFTGLTTTTLSASTSATIGTTLGVTGAVTLSSTLAAGASTLASLGVTGAATIGTTLGVTGTSTLGVLNAFHSTFASATVTGAASIGTTLGVTGASTLASLGVTGAATVGSTLGVTTSITSPSYLFTSASTGINRIAMICPQSDPANWKSTTLGHWINLSLGTKVVCNIDPPQGSTITGVTIRFLGAAAHAGLPANMPVADLRYYDTASNLDLSIGSATDSSANTAAFQANHSIVISGLSHTVDKRTARYHLDLTAESGANALVGGTLVYVQYTFTRPAGSSVGLD